MDLAEILDGEAPSADESQATAGQEAIQETAAETEQPSTTEEAGKVAETTGDEPTGDKTEQLDEVSAPDPKKNAEPDTVPISALKAQRELRQEYQRKYEEALKNQQPSKQQEQESQQGAPDPITEPEAYQAHVNKQIQQAAFNERANISEFMAKKDYPDLDEKVEVYKKLTESNPALMQRAMNAASPFHEIYDIVKQHEEQKILADVGSVDALRAQIRAEVEAELKGQTKETEAAPAETKAKPQIPTSLVDEPSKGTVTKQPAKEGQTPLENIFGD